jgi:probable F420-dependent oxidoreductase
VEFWQAIAHTESDQLLDVARLSEEYGFTAVTTGDHFVTPARIESPYPYTQDERPWVDPEDSTPDPMVLAAAIAQVTRHLKFFVTCYVLPMRDPFAAAKAISTAAVLTGNRLILGVGVGWMREEFELTGHDFRNRGRRCDEMLEILGRLLGGGMVEFHGEYYDFAPVQMVPVPDAPVPILIAGHSDAAFRRGARYDDPIITLPLDHEPSLDDCKRLEDIGVTAIINMPLTFKGEATSSLERKRAELESYAERVILPMTR